MIEDYEKRTKENGFERFIWIMATTVGVRKGIVKRDCVTEAINLLEKKEFQLTKTYMKRKDICQFYEIDKFINEIKGEEIISNKEYERQAKEFDNIIINSM